MPISILEKDRVQINSASYSNYQRVINNKIYSSYISFDFYKEKESVTFNIEGNYKVFKTSLILENTLKDNLIGELTIFWRVFIMQATMCN